MSILAQSRAMMEWLKEGWTVVTFPALPKDQVIIGGAKVILINSAREVVYIDQNGDAFEIDLYNKEFIKTTLRPAEPQPDSFSSPKP